MRSNAFKLALFILTFVGSAHAEIDQINMDLGTKNSSSAEYIFAGQRGYSKSSAESAYVTHRLIGTYLQYKDDPTIGADPERSNSKMLADIANQGAQILANQETESAVLIHLRGLHKTAQPNDPIDY